MGGVWAVCSSSPAHGQSVVQSLGNHLRYAAGDIWGVWTSPLRGSQKDWLIALGVVAGSAALSPLDDNVDRWLVRNEDLALWDPLTEVREGGIAFSGKTITPVALGALAIALATNNQRVQEGLFGCLAAYASTSIARNFVFYPLVARTRPDSSRGEPDSPPAKQGDQYEFDFPGSSEWGRHSFPAGHVANIAACASFLGNRFSMGIVEPVVYVVAGGVGVGRMVDRRHWLSDTVLGILFGYAAGKEVALRSSRREQRGSTPQVTGQASSGFSLSPSSRGVTLSWRKTF
jgi:membrane-associated phospholipid phosphatase